MLEYKKCLKNKTFKVARCNKNNYNEIIKLGFITQDKNNNYGFAYVGDTNSTFKVLNIGDFVIFDDEDCVVDILDEDEFDKHYLFSFSYKLLK